MMSGASDTGDGTGPPGSGTGSGAEQARLGPPSHPTVVALAVLRHLPWILGLALIAGVAAFVVSSFQPRIYEATASLIMLPVRSRALLAEELTTEANRIPLELRTRQEALKTMCHSQAVSEAVFAALGDRLEGLVSRAALLRNRVSIDVGGELLIVRARANDAELAADLATVWAREAERRINAVYGQAVHPLAQIAEQGGQALATYKSAQARLESFLEQSRLRAIEQEIAYLEKFLETSRELVAEGMGAGYTATLNERRSLLEGTLTELERTESALLTASVLEDLLAGGTPSTALEWATALSLVGQLSSKWETRPILAVTLSDSPPALTLEDVRRYSEAQKAHLERLRSTVAGLRKKILSGRLEVGRRGDGGAETWWEPTTNRLVELHAEKERVEASERLLAAERDVAWETYEVLARKQAEVEHLQKIPGSEVQLLEEATPPRRWVSPRRGYSTATATIVAFVLALVAALALESWRLLRSPGLHGR